MDRTGEGGGEEQGESKEKWFGEKNNNTRTEEIRLGAEHVQPEDREEPRSPGELVDEAALFAKPGQDTAVG